MSKDEETKTMIPASLFRSSFRDYASNVEILADHLSLHFQHIANIMQLHLLTEGNIMLTFAGEKLVILFW